MIKYGAWKCAIRDPLLYIVDIEVSTRMTACDLESA